MASGSSGGSEAARVLHRIRDEVQRLVEADGCELWDVSYRTHGSRATLTVTVDDADGVSAERCQQLSKTIGAYLDAADPIPRSYTLIVSSPGIERVLTRDEHYTRFAGRLASIRIVEPDGKRRSLAGRLGGLVDGQVLLTLESDETIRLPMESIEETRLRFDWDEERARQRL
jgi:ribosome maturation factor RimP